jgi:hypothetical protein
VPGGENVNELKVPFKNVKNVHEKLNSIVINM